MFGPQAPTLLKSRTATNYSVAKKRPLKGQYQNLEFPFHGASKQNRKDETTDKRLGYDNGHLTLSGLTELMELLDGQETIVKQNVLDRVGKLKSAPYIHAVRTIIMQEVRDAS